MNRYSRQDVLRILRISSRQLHAWEKVGLIAAAQDYGFQDLVQLRKLRDLRAMRISASSICASVHAMRAVSGMANPLLEAGVARRGPRLVFRHSGATVDPIGGQFELDFEAGTQCLAAVGACAESTIQRQNQISSLFFEAVRCEEQGKIPEATALYEEILVLAEHAPAAINLGTILYNQKQFNRAERFYRRATEASPDYALAFFDLGNALDELQRLCDAIDAYKSAIRLAPGYADAHYNLALAYERSNERRRALQHWTTYARLDPIGPWANHARLQAKKILERDPLSVVWRSGKPPRPLPRRQAESRSRRIRLVATKSPA
ncbi:MAG TPA: tetratricopeptide repeat protein [Acidobacteriaceae bacterium]|nr:tetratricopeptide repeat protein [Acidobacteriaceae bacterium]